MMKQLSCSFTRKKTNHRSPAADGKGRAAARQDRAVLPATAPGWLRLPACHRVGPGMIAGSGPAPTQPVSGPAQHSDSAGLPVVPPPPPAADLRLIELTEPRRRRRPEGLNTWTGARQAGPARCAVVAADGHEECVSDGQGKVIH